MSDLARGAPEAETPVNPYSLLEAVNRSSDTAHTSWLIFLAIMAYLLIAVAGVTHKDLLLETAVALPILQVEIPLAQFFQFAPIVLVVLHLGLISQLSLLARETIEFDQAVSLLEASDRRTHPLRLELNNFFFVQAIAGPHRSRVMSAFLHAMSWLTLVVLPVVLLLYIQVVFLPYHDISITWTHRLALFFDIAILVSIGFFLLRAETSFIDAFLRTTVSHPLSFLTTMLMLATVTLFSFFIATIPGEPLDKLTQRAFGTNQEDDAGPAPRYIAGYAIPFLSFGSEGSLLGVFKRNLVVTDTDLVVDKEQTPGEPSLSLRDRDLRFARLDRSDLHQADLTGADLRGASLVGTDLRGAWLMCADVTRLVLSDDRDEARCTTARRADFTRARLDGAHLAGIDLRRAKLEDARLEGVELQYSLLTGANFASAKLDKADMTGGIHAEGTSFLLASLQGADLTGALLVGAELSNAYLQGAVLDYAHLELANLRDADLEAASLVQASLIGTDLTGARLAAADLRNVRIWMTKPPTAEGQAFADLQGAAVDPVTDTNQQRLKQLIEGASSRSVRERLGEAAQPLLDLANANTWANSPEEVAWRAFVTQATPAIPDTYRLQLTDFLAKLQCRPRWSNGAIATGIARRAQTRQFRGDLLEIYDRLKAETCPAGKSVPTKTLKDLAAAADLLRPN